MQKIVEREPTRGVCVVNEGALCPNTCAREGQCFWTPSHIGIVGPETRLTLDGRIYHWWKDGGIWLTFLTWFLLFESIFVAALIIRLVW